MYTPYLGSVVSIAFYNIFITSRLIVLIFIPGFEICLVGFETIHSVQLCTLSPMLSMIESSMYTSIQLISFFLMVLVF
jgi:hypothetical protein